MQKKLTVLISALLFFSSQNSHAFYETGESGEIAKEGTYKIGLMPQLRLSDGSGMNFTGFFDRALNDESSLRIHAGLGETDFYMGGSYKWIPIPDYKNQPAIGGKSRPFMAVKTVTVWLRFEFIQLFQKNSRLITALLFLMVQFLLVLPLIAIKLRRNLILLLVPNTYPIIFLIWNLVAS